MRQVQRKLQPTSRELWGPDSPSEMAWIEARELSFPISTFTYFWISEEWREARPWTRHLLSAKVKILGRTQILSLSWQLILLEARGVSALVLRRRVWGILHSIPYTACALQTFCIVLITPYPRFDHSLQEAQNSQMSLITWTHYYTSPNLMHYLPQLYKSFPWVL